MTLDKHIRSGLGPYLVKRTGERRGAEDEHKNELAGVSEFDITCCY